MNFFISMNVVLLSPKDKQSGIQEFTLNVIRADRFWQ